MGILLAFVAVLGMNTAFAFHNALPHDDDHPHLAMQATDHDHREKGDPDGFTHQAMHEVVQAMNAPNVAPFVPEPRIVRTAWSIGASPAIAGISPASLMRPPRA